MSASPAVNIETSVAVNGKNMIMIFDHKDVGMYVVEFRTLGAPASGRLDMETDYVATADAVGGRVDRQSIFRRAIRADAPNRRVVDQRAGRERGEVRHRVRSPARTIWRRGGAGAGHSWCRARTRTLQRRVRPS